MVPLDAELKALAALVSLAFASIVLIVPGRSARNLWLAAFLLLIAGNQGAETMRALGGPHVEAWYRLAAICAAIDPLALLMFVSAALGPVARPSRLFLGYVLLASGALALYAGWTLQLNRATNGDPVAFSLAVSVHTLLVYGWCLVVSVRRLREDPTAPWGIMIPALAVAVMPRAIDMLNAVFAIVLLPRFGGAHDPPPYFYGLLAASLALMALMVGLLVREARRATHPVAKRRLAQAALAAGLVLALVKLPGVLLGTPLIGESPRIDAVNSFLGRSGAAVRWLVFGAFASAMVFTDETPRFSPAQRRLASRGLLVIAFMTFAATLLVAIFGTLGYSASTLAAAVFVALAALALSQGFRGLVDATARTLYGVPRQGEAEALPETRVGPGATLASRYRVVRALGGGGSGETFLAWDEHLRREVALKVVPASGPAALREARIAGAVHHPFVVAVHDVLQRRASVVLVMEYVSGGSLADRIEREGPLPLAQGAALLDEIAQGVSAVHALGVVHRDLTPANILLTPEGRPKIADFGIAGRVGRRTLVLGDTLLRMGTPGFVAPEQARGETPTAAADVYALGVMLRAAVRGPLPASLEAVAARATLPDPAKRWPDAKAFLDALRLALPVHERAASDVDDVAVRERRGPLDPP
ncbi:MAG: eukaryotic-like serine/threonine-protein kinase [Thermoplasmata archaeon]|nr:eukaryotic-like serine/threonine-protein kinase [Thermoplasmata archaeon]